MSIQTFSLVFELFNAKNYEAAADAARSLLKAEPDNHQAYFLLGLSKSKLKRHLEAEAAYRHAVALSPDDRRYYVCLGAALGEQERYEEAAEYYAKAVELGENDLDFRRTYARLLLRIGRLSEAEAELGYVFGENPEDKETGYDLARILKYRQEFSAAADIYKQILTIDSEWPEARKHIWNCLLLSGRLTEGFIAYEERFTLGFLTKRNLPYPTWNGEFTLGLRLFVHAEQGYGDIIQMSRYIPLLAKKGMRITLECPPFIASLLEGVLGLERIIWTGDDLPTDIDAEISIMSLPHRFGTELDTIPADIPYIFPDADKVDAWRERLGPGKKIGLAWQGNPSFPNDSKRSFPLAALAPLFTIPGSLFLSLQKEHGREQLEAFPQIIDLGPLLLDFGETAAIIANLDLFISCDTGLAHIAGAMGKPTWLALPYEPDWRWMVKRSDSPWYPSLRLFRQPSEGDWTSVFQNMAKALS
jgi:Flp pilus assembly protein TadD